VWNITWCIISSFARLFDMCWLLHLCRSVSLFHCVELHDFCVSSRVRVADWLCVMLVERLRCSLLSHIAFCLSSIPCVLYCVCVIAGSAHHGIILPALLRHFVLLLFIDVIAVVCSAVDCLWRSPLVTCAKQDCGELDTTTWMVAHYALLGSCFTSL